MATPTEVLQQATRLQTGTRFERARAGATALSAFLQLSPEDKRSLAVMVAQRVAPELVPRIQSEAGLDLTAEQSRAVLDMIGRLDGDDLQELASAVATADGRRATMATMADSAATATGLDDVVRPEPQPVESGGTGSGQPSGSGPGASAAGAAGAAAVGAATAGAAAQQATAQRRDDFGAAQSASFAKRIAELEASLAAAEATVRADEQALERTTHQAQQAHDRAEQAEADLRDALADADVVRRDHETELSEVRRRLRRATRELEEAGGGSMSSTAIATAAVPGPTTSAFDSLPEFGMSFSTDLDSDLLPTPSPTGGTVVAPTMQVGTLVATMEAGSASAALRHLRAWMPRLRTTSAPDRARILQAIPDGWARRRALQRMVESGVAGLDDVRSLQLLERAGDQVFAGGSMLDAGLPLDQVLANVSETARTRLIRRAA